MNPRIMTISQLFVKGYFCRKSPALHLLSQHVAQTFILSYFFITVLMVDRGSSVLLHTLGHVPPSPVLRITSILFSNVTDMCDFLVTLLHSLGFTALLLLDMSALTSVI